MEPEQHLSEPHRHGGFSLAFGAAALFGAATPFSKQLLANLSPNQLAGLLYLGAALFLAPAVAVSVRRGAAVWPRDTRNAMRLLGAILFGGIIGPVLLLAGLRAALAASVSMWLNLETVATAILAALLFKEHLGKWAWLGNAGVLASGVLLSFDRGSAGVWGILCVGGAAAAWGVDNNLTATIDGITPQVSTFWKGLVAGAFNLAMGCLLVPPAPGIAWFWALALGGVSYGISISLYIASAQRLGAARSQMAFASAPFFGVVFSMLWLGEGMSAVQILAGVLLTGAVAVLLIEHHGHEHEHHALTHEHSHRHDEGHHDHTHTDAPPHARHTHPHTHAPLRHRHPHWPDLHHRHDH